MGSGGSKNNESLKQNVDNTDKIPERKIIFVGDGVGKSAIIHRFMSNSLEWFRGNPTLGVKNQYKIVDVPVVVQDGKPKQIKLDIWDTSGGSSMF